MHAGIPRAFKEPDTSGQQFRFGPELYYSARSSDRVGRVTLRQRGTKEVLLFINTDVFPQTGALQILGDEVRNEVLAERQLETCILSNSHAVRLSSILCEFYVEIFRFGSSR